MKSCFTELWHMKALKQNIVDLKKRLIILRRLTVRYSPIYQWENHTCVVYLNLITFYCDLANLSNQVSFARSYSITPSALLHAFISVVSNVPLNYTPHQGVVSCSQSYDRDQPRLWKNNEASSYLCLGFGRDRLKWLRFTQCNAPSLSLINEQTLLKSCRFSHMEKVLIVLKSRKCF